MSATRIDLELAPSYVLYLNSKFLRICNRALEFSIVFLARIFFVRNCQSTLFRLKFDSPSNCPKSRFDLNSRMCREYH